MNLPTELDPLKACRAGQVLEGNLVPTDLPRLEGLMGKVHYHLSCGFNEKKEPELRILLQAKFTLICQRCNQPMQYILNEEIYLEEPDVFKPIDVIEDELILALPMIPMHEEKDCAFSQNTAYSPVENENNRYKPFTDLGKKLDLKE